MYNSGVYLCHFTTTLWTGVFEDLKILSQLFCHTNHCCISNSQNSLGWLGSNKLMCHTEYIQCLFSVQFSAFTESNIMFSTQYRLQNLLINLIGKGVSISMTAHYSGFRSFASSFNLCYLYSMWKFFWGFLRANLK